MYREIMNWFQGMLILLLILRLFKYLNFIRGLKAVYRTVISAGVDIAYFFVLFLAIMMAFVFAGYVVFGPTTERFSTITESIVTILRLVVLDFDYKVFERQGMSGLTYLIASMFFFYFLLVNIFTAIVLSSWVKEKDKLDQSTAQRVKLPAVNWKEMLYYVVCCGWLLDLCRILTHPARSCRRLVIFWKDYQSQMGWHEIDVRLVQWHSKKNNSRTEFMDFDRIMQSLAGGQKNRREVSPYQGQLVMRLCKQNRKGEPKKLFTTKEMQRQLMENANEEDMNDFAPEEDSVLDSVANLKKLVDAVHLVHTNQRQYWKDAMATLTGIQTQTMQAQNRLHSITTRVDGMINQ